MGTCPQGINIPPSTIEPCSGKYTDSSCTLHSQALVEFGLPADSSIHDIIQTMYMAIVSMQARITELETV